MQTGDKKKYEEYKMKATTQNKMKLDICDAYIAKETLGYRERKSYVSAVRGTAKTEEKQRGTGEKTNLQANYWSPPNKQER